MIDQTDIVEAGPEDAAAMAAIHLSARHQSMPYLYRPHTDEEVTDWFAGAVGDRPAAWWVARSEGRVVGYMLIDGEDIDHLYVLPGWERRGIGRSLLDKAKTLSPKRLALSTFQRNAKAIAFYESQGFSIVGYTNGHNEEEEPDVQYVWDGW
jgi:ribosomal protein S18 acetylase RimI-like enzyme